HRRGAAGAAPRPLAPHRLAGVQAGRAHSRRARGSRGGRRASLAAGRGAALRRTFSSLRYRNYRLFFTGQAVSQTGSWMQPIAFLNGLVLVLDVPSRQQLTYRMVGREALPNAIALNSSLFNASRIFGPSLAGVILGFAGVGVCFIVNAVSFLAVLVGLLAMRSREFFTVEEFERPSILRGTREGLAYVRRQPRMLVVLGLTVVLSTFCFNFNVTLPVLAYTTLHTHAL